MPEFTAALISLLMDSNVTMIYLAIIKGRGNVILNRTGLEHQSYDYIVATYSLHHLNYKVLSSAACSLNSIILAMVSVAVSSSNFLANSLPDSNNIGMSL